MFVDQVDHFGDAGQPLGKLSSIVVDWRMKEDSFLTWNGTPVTINDESIGQMKFRPKTHTGTDVTCT
jgi:hypothetical protein